MQMLSLSFRQSKKNHWSVFVLKKNNILRKVILTIVRTKLIEYDVMWGVYTLCTHQAWAFDSGLPHIIPSVISGSSRTC